MFEDEGYVSGPLVTVADAARYLGVGRKIVYRLIEDGELSAVKNRGAVLIERRSLDNYKASGKLS
jgi:excisionase family DNA binding protein